jgi:hypothetical protein
MRTHIECLDMYIANWSVYLSKFTYLDKSFWCSNKSRQYYQHFLFMIWHSHWVRATSLLRLHDQTQFDTPHSVGLLWTSDRPVAGDLYLTTHNIHKRQTYMPSAGFELAKANERPQTHCLDPVDNGVCITGTAQYEFQVRMQGWTKDARNCALAASDNNNAEPSGYWTHSLIDYTIYLEFILRNMGVRNKCLGHYFFLHISLPGGTTNLEFPAHLSRWLNEDTDTTHLCG